MMHPFVEKGAIGELNIMLKRTREKWPFRGTKS